jgi:predicted DNA-binding protein YlxM (UPF0122 family)
MGKLKLDYIKRENILKDSNNFINGEKTIISIAREHDVHPTTVRRLLKIKQSNIQDIRNDNIQKKLLSQNEKVLKKLEEGLSIPEISDDEGINKSTIYRRLKKREIEHKGINRRMVIKDYNDHKPVPQIAKEHNIHKSTVYRWVKLNKMANFV